MSKNETRLGRINEELRKEISNIITFELKDPNITGLISVTKVKITIFSALFISSKILSKVIKLLLFLILV